MYKSVDTTHFECGTQAIREPFEYVPYVQFAQTVSLNADPVKVIWLNELYNVSKAVVITGVIK